METFTQAFRDALTMIGLGEKRAKAIKAHEDVRDVLARDETLKSWKVQTILIGSYGRETAIYPGRDVDVFVKLPDGPNDPEAVFEAVRKPLVAEYGDDVEVHRRSLMIKFGDDFSVDAVPAIPTASHWQIPEADENGNRTRWEETDPENLTELTHRRNDDPIVDGDGAYVPTAKLIRQIRRHHLADAKPGGFYFELEAYAAFEAGVSGSSRAEILASTLDRIAAHLETGQVVNNPALGLAYEPTPDPADIAAAADKFHDLATKAAQALAAERCPAAVLWREILGKNEQGWVFALPVDCDERGNVIGAITPIADKGSREAHPFA